MLTSNIQRRLLKEEQQVSLRVRHVIDNDSQNRIVVDGIKCLNFSSNDYLGLTKHPSIIEAFSTAIKKHGFGSGASAVVSGYSVEHAETEYAFSAWLKVDKAILFNSGYLANLGVIRALADRTKIIFSDKLCHASLLDGIQLSKAKHYRYRHGDWTHLDYLASQHKPDLIVTESVFSMEGSVAPLKTLATFSQQYQADLLIDDAHGIGILGKTGRGACEYYGMNQDAFACLVLPLGKAFNAFGAIVAGRAEIIEAILQFSKTYRYTTALPPGVCAAIRAALKVVCEESWRRNQLKENIQFFISYAAHKGINLASKNETPIKPILLYENSKVVALQNFLLSRKFYVYAVRPPSVPANQARLRICLNCLHTQEEMMQLIDNIVQFFRKAC